MKIIDAQFITSSPSYTKMTNENLPEIVVLGRSNVGKSTFINKFCNRKTLVKISSKPGKTKLLNIFLINHSFYFVDVPGYGYAKVSKKERAEFGKMIEEYLNNRTLLKFAVLLIDFKVGPTEDDLLMYEFLKFLKIKTVVIATKKDKVKNSMHFKQKKIVVEKMKIIQNDELIVYSSQNEKDINLIRQKFAKILGGIDEI